jgi:hypothetical protein
MDRTEQASPDNRDKQPLPFLPETFFLTPQGNPFQKFLSDSGQFLGFFLHIHLESWNFPFKPYEISGKGLKFQRTERGDEKTFERIPFNAIKRVLEPDEIILFLL